MSDTATAALMERFYKRYLGSGDMARALREAVRQMRKTPGFEHPDTGRGSC